jgi:hypothetical protein
MARSKKSRLPVSAKESEAGRGWLCGVSGQQPDSEGVEARAGGSESTVGVG